MPLQTSPVDTIYQNLYAVTGMQLCSSQDGVAAAGSTQATATPIFAQQVNVTTVPASSGVVFQNPSVAGMEVAVNNNQGTNALLVYPFGSEKINALAASAGFSVAVNTVVIFYCFTAGQWFTK